MINPDILNDICCPLGKAPLKLENNSFVCTKCNVIYPIIDEIPYLMIEDAILPEGADTIADLICQKEKLS